MDKSLGLVAKSLRWIDKSLRYTDRQIDRLVCLHGVCFRCVLSVCLSVPRVCHHVVSIKCLLYVRAWVFLPSSAIIIAEREPWKPERRPMLSHRKPSP